MASYTTPQVVAISGVTSRRLDYWVRIGLIAPSIAPAAGSGSSRLWNGNDIRVARAVAALLPDGGNRNASLPFDLVRRLGVVDILRSCDWSGYLVLTCDEARIVADASDVADIVATSSATVRVINLSDYASTIRKEWAPCCTSQRDEQGRLPVGFCGPDCVRRPVAEDYRTELAPVPRQPKTPRAKRERAPAPPKVERPRGIRPGTCVRSGCVREAVPGTAWCKQDQPGPSRGTRQPA